MKKSKIATTSNRSESTIPTAGSKKRITFDFETRSACHLKKSGAFKYSRDLTTRPTCLAIKVHGDSQITFLAFHQINKFWQDLAPEFRNWWRRFIRESYEFSAHNAFFERAIYTNILVARYGWPEIPAEQYRCTAAKAAACALPRNLAGAGEALGLSVQKDKRGYIAMMATCRPVKAWTAWNKKGRIGPEPKMFLDPEDAPEIWNTLYEYCKIDVLAEEALDEALPDLTSEEQEIWHLNQRMNWRGLRIDVPLVEKIVGIMEVESKKKLKALDSLTMGFVTKPGARKSIMDFLELEGVRLPNLQKQTVDDKLQSFDLSPDMRSLLELRKALSLTSTRKYQAFLSRAGSDGHVRDILLYHGASTGRDTGTGVQPHNFPRGIIKVSRERPYAHVENVVDLDVEMLRALYGDSLSTLFSSILRNMILPNEGHELFVADFSKIEVAVLWWLADNEPGLKVLRSGKDPYKYQAAANTGKTYEEIAEEGNERQLGKAQVLGCGFGMGAPKFQKSAWDMYRLKLSEEQSKQAVDNYRRANAAVPELWKAYERAAVAAVESPGQTIEAGKCAFRFSRGFLWARLPSGRKLAYRDPQIAWRETDYGPRKTLEFWGVNPKTKKWSIERTWGGSLTENLVQATARDLLMPAMVRLEKAKYRALLTVHDEGICERKIGKGSVDEFVRILCQVPRWGEGLPIDAKGWSGYRYRK